MIYGYNYIKENLNNVLIITIIIAKQAKLFSMDSEL